MAQTFLIDHTKQPTEQWRTGVITRMHVSAAVGANQLCVFEQWCEPGLGAPLHTHAVEEVLTVLAGQAQVVVNGEKSELSSGQSVIVSAGISHGFKNIGDGELHVRAILAAPVFEAAYEDGRETSRRWPPPDAIC